MEKKKILILTASPQRDKLVDEMIAEELRTLGNEVFVWPCLRKGRSTNEIFELQPNVVVLPPIRNPMSRDMAEYLMGWGVGVVSRHTEPSCDWQDFNAMDNNQKQHILGLFPYRINLEIVWGQDEAQILSRRGVPFPVVSVGSLSTDKYLNEEFQKKYKNKKAFNQKYKFDNKKKTILIQSPWGFADHAPDLNIDETSEAKKDNEGRTRHLQMIKEIALKNKFNILVTIHPGVLEEPYKKVLDELKIPLDTESQAMEMLINSDSLIHAGSTVALGAHILGIPAFQYGDVNWKGSDNWWGRSESPISHVSPYFKKVDKLIEAIKDAKPESNANKTSIKKLETGRYGKMDGKATVRVAKLINKINGKMKFCWPKSHRDYTQLTLLKTPNDIIQQTVCSVCKDSFCIVKQEWLDKLSNAIGHKEKILPPKNNHCPNCGARFYVYSSDNPSPAKQPATAQ